MLKRTLISRGPADNAWMDGLVVVGKRHGWTALWELHEWMALSSMPCSTRHRTLTTLKSFLLVDDEQRMPLGTALHCYLFLRRSYTAYTGFYLLQLFSILLCLPLPSSVTFLFNKIQACLMIHPTASVRELYQPTLKVAKVCVSHNQHCPCLPFELGG